jgi:suppressor of ftsI
MMRGNTHFWLRGKVDPSFGCTGNGPAQWARPQDDVLDMVAMPGEALDYTLAIPRDHLPGLDWYHTHPHGESHRQVLDGMSGALISEGIEAYAAEVRILRERVLLIRELDIESNPNAAALRAVPGE